MKTNHPVLYAEPTESQKRLVDVTMDVTVLRREFPKLFDILVKNTKGNWKYWNKEERRGAKTPLQHAETSQDSFIIVPVDSDMAEAFTVEDYVQPIPGHMALFMENNGFTNVTLVFVKDGLVG